MTFAAPAPKNPIVGNQLDAGKPTTTTASFTIQTPVVSSITVPPSAFNKTDQLDTFGRAAPSSFNYEKSRVDHQKASSDGSSLDTDVSMSATDDDKTGQKNASNVPPAATDASLESKVGANKRSLLDLDNASSLSLADKLRNEANKYADDARSSGNAFGVTENHSQNHKGGESMGGVTHGTLQLNTATGATIVTERRPSWRLRFDAGSKVRYETIKFNRC